MDSHLVTGRSVVRNLAKEFHLRALTSSMPWTTRVCDPGCTIPAGERAQISERGGQQAEETYVCITHRHRRTARQ